MKTNDPIVLVLLALLLFLSACTSAPEPDIQPTEDQPQLVAVEEQDAVEQEEIEEEEQEPAVAELDAVALFAANCARCHAEDRTGGRGPALLPSSLNQDASAYGKIILNGRSGMPAFDSKLSEEEISALVEFILSEPQ